MFGDIDTISALGKGVLIALFLVVPPYLLSLVINRYVRRRLQLTGFWTFAVDRLVFGVLLLLWYFSLLTFYVRTLF